MEQNIPLTAKKIWHIMRVAFFMLRKGICKRKILMDFNMMMKRGKIAGKALGRNLMFNHHHHHRSEAYPASTSQGEEYEFSCSNTPLYHHYFTNKKEKKPNQPYILSPFNEMDNINADEVNKVLEMMLSNPSSPALPGLLGFGKSPMVRQLRITDSPFPLQNNPEDNKRVDEAAEDFIKKFYLQLKQQNY